MILNMEHTTPSPSGCSAFCIESQQPTANEEISQRCKGVTAMKFFKGQENARIYCKEVTTEDKVFVVITSELLERKKSTKLTKKDRQLIEKVASYEFTLEE